MKQYHKNPRQITDKQLGDLERWLGEFGDLSGIVHDLNSDEIISGNQRLRVFDPDKCEVVLVSGDDFDEPDAQGTVALGYVLWEGNRYGYRAVRWTEEQCAQANVVANRAGGEWDWDMLANEFEVGDLLDWGFTEVDFQLAGWDTDEEPPADPGPQIDKAAELQEKWGTALGQLWELGEHRLVCGDCTDGDVVDLVMGGEKAGACVTDPPYGVGVDYGSFDDTPENVKALIQGVMPVILDNLPAAFTPGVPMMWEYPKPQWVGTWVHPAASGSCPWGFVGNNPILFYGKDPYLKAGKGRRLDSLVMAADRQGESSHPVIKPIKVWEWLVERLTPEQGQLVFDPFCGSGTTIVACERLSRRCRAIEIEPKYVAVTLDRWATMTGREPVLVEG